MLIYTQADNLPGRYSNEVFHIYLLLVLEEKDIDGHNESCTLWVFQYKFSGKNNPYTVLGGGFINFVKKNLHWWTCFFSLWSPDIINVWVMKKVFRMIEIIEYIGNYKPKHTNMSWQMWEKVVQCRGGECDKWLPITKQN